MLQSKHCAPSIPETRNELKKPKHCTLTLTLPKTLPCKVFTKAIFWQHPYAADIFGFAYLLGYHQWYWFCHSSTRAAMLHPAILRECSNFLQYRTQTEPNRLQHPSVQILLVSVYLKHIKLIVLILHFYSKANQIHYKVILEIFSLLKKVSKLN